MRALKISQPTQEHVEASLTRKRTQERVEASVTRKRRRNLKAKWLVIIPRHSHLISLGTHGISRDTVFWYLAYAEYFFRVSSSVNEVLP